MQNKVASTPEEYIAALPADRRAPITAVRSMVKKHLPNGYAEFVNYGMLNYGIPLTKLPKPDGQPLCYVALAAQKNYCSLYLMSVYGDKRHEKKLRDAFDAAGKKLDMGKSCIRFQTADDLPLEAVGEIIGSVSSEKWIEIFEASRKKKRR
jgi:uncharacterized protein YdhG (YjbR/CyaY superfamily)